MASTYASLSYHVIFGTKYRKPMLTEDIRAETYKYIAGIIKKKNGLLLEIGGIADHVHLLASCSARMALADFVRDVKANSSKWLHEEKNKDLFQWQTGYAAFTVSYSNVPKVRQYVRNQEEHHRRLTFEEEYFAILKRHGIEFDKRYVFDEEIHG